MTGNDRVTGEYYVESDIVFDSSGKRTERFTKAPPNTLQFSSGAQRIRMLLKYDNYKQFQADVKLTFGDAVDGENSKGGGASKGEAKAPALDPKLSTTKKK